VSPHTIPWAGGEVTVEQWVLIDQVNRQKHYFADPQACADKWNAMKAEPGGSVLTRLTVVMDGRLMTIAPIEAVRPVYVAMGLWEP
jgi:hypothetical protein